MGSPTPPETGVPLAWYWGTPLTWDWGISLTWDCGAATCEWCTSPEGTWDQRQGYPMKRTWDQWLQVLWDGDRVTPLADPGFGQGGPQKQSEVSKVSQYWAGSRARTHLKVLEALLFLTLKYPPRILFVHLHLFSDTLLCGLGVWGPLGVSETVTLLAIKCAFFHFSWYFFFKNLNLYLCRHIHKISISI